MPQKRVLAHDSRNPLAIPRDHGAELVGDQGLCSSKKHRDIPTILGDEMRGFIQSLFFG